jgi:hypothetical protein
VIKVVFPSNDCTGMWKSMTIHGKGDVCTDNHVFDTRGRCKFINNTGALAAGANASTTESAPAKAMSLLDKEFVDFYILYIVGGSKDTFQDLYMKYKDPRGSALDDDWPGMLPGVIDLNNLNWEFSSAIFFVITIITTIGYGTFAPETSGGMVFTIFFAFLGIAYFGIVLGLVGTNLIACIKGTAKCILHRNEPNYRLSGKRTLLWATITMFFYITMIGVACNIMDADEWPIGIAMWCKLSIHFAVAGRGYFLFFFLLTSSYYFCGKC